VHALKKIVFSSDDLPPDLGDRARFDLWHDIHNADIASIEYAISETTPFYARMEAMAFGPVVVGTMACSIQSAGRSAGNIARDNVGGYNLFVNAGEKLIGGTQSGREFVLDPGEAVLMSNFEPLRLFGGDENAWMTIIMPDAALHDVLVNADDRTARRVGSDNEALRLLKRYCGFLNGGPPLHSSSLLTHVSNTLIDLVGASLGAEKTAEDHAGARGVRAARLIAVTESIREHFSNPAISAKLVARQLGLSVRYLHELLQETGESFGERVMELRLQKTRLMLSARHYDHLRISEIALQSGFNDISYFNRSFRRRFGCTPASVR
jgi:AraC-like DNA-binding protein